MYFLTSTLVTLIFLQPTLGQRQLVLTLALSVRVLTLYNDFYRYAWTFLIPSLAFELRRYPHT